MITLKWFNKDGISGGTFLAKVRDGVVYTDNYNEQLDSATVVIEFQSKLDFEPFDMVELTLPQIGTVTMLIDDFVENEVNLEQGLYQYTLNLMSKTKELEREVLPNFAVTKGKNTSAKSLKTVIDGILINTPQVYVNSALTRKYQLSSDETTALDAVSCPDLQVSKPTLREAIDRVLSTDNRICYLDGSNNIKTLDLNARKSKITLDKYYSYKPENQSSSDYATETENNYNNVVPVNITGVKNDTTVTEYLGFRTEAMLLTSENAQLITSNPIYDLKKVVWCGLLKFTRKNLMLGMFEFDAIAPFGGYDNQFGDATGTYYFEIDITDYILESQNFNILDYETKKKRAYYTRGSNKIEGLLAYKKGFLENYVTLSNILHDAMLGNKGISASTDFGSALTSKLPDAIAIVRLGTSSTCDFYIDTWFENTLYAYSMFKIEYEPQVDNLRTRTSKYLPERNQQNVIVDNPSESYVDIRRQGQLFTQKCNRLGNRVQYLTARFPITHSIPNLGDYYNDKVLIRRELQFYDNYIIFKGTLTENYVNINYFTGINARKRSWNILSSSEAFDRQMLDKWYCVLTLDKNTPSDTMTSSDGDSKVMGVFAFQLLQCFYYDASHTIIDHAWLWNTIVGDTAAKVEVDLTSYISGNSLVFQCKAENNYSLGIRITGYTTGGYTEQYCRYVDNNGETTWLSCYLVNKYTPSGVPTMYKAYSSTEDIASFYQYSNQKPLIAANDTDSNIVYKNTFRMLKDNREKLGFNIQFEFVSNTPSIVIGAKFLERQRFDNTIARNNVKIFVYNDTYKVTDTKFKDGYEIAYDSSIVVVSESNEKARVELNVIAALLEFKKSHLGYLTKSLAITDGDNNLIIAINRVVTSEALGGNKFYLRMQKVRDRHNYSSRDLKTWGDNI